MKKVFQIKLKSIAKVFTLVVAASLVTFTGCKSYDGDIDNLQGQIDKVVTDVTTLKTSVAALQTSVNGMTYIKSITMGTDGKLTITPSTGTAIVYDAKNYVTYDIALTNNVLTVNGVNKGTVAIPALTFADGVLKSGTTTVADLTSWLKTGLTVVDGYLAINGQKTSVAIPVAAGKTVKDVAIDGTNVKVTYTDNTTATFANAPIVTSTSADGTLVVNGVDTKVVIKNTYGVDGGFLTVNGVKTTVAIPAENKTSVIFSKDGNGNIISATISDGKDTMVVKLNPSEEPLAGLIFVPGIVNNGVNALELGYIMNKTQAPVVPQKTLFSQPSVTYRLNPTTTDVTKITAWKVITYATDINTTVYSVKGAQRVIGDNYAMFVPTRVPNTRADGSEDFTLKVGTWTEPTSGLTNTISLEATYKDVYSGLATKVVSNYAKVMPVAYNAYISKFGTTSHLGTLAYSGTKFVMPSPAPAKTVTPDPATYDFPLVYNATTKTNVNNLLSATGNKINMIGTEATLEALKFGKLGVDYKFVFYVPTLSNSTALNLGIDNITDDNAFINLESNGDITVLQGTASIGRAPMVIVELQSMSGALLANGYIRFRINPSDVITPAAVNIPVNPAPFVYNTLFNTATGNKTDISVNWTQMNAAYTALNVSHDDFNIFYATTTPTAKYSYVHDAGSIGTDVTNASDPVTKALFPLTVSPNSQGVDTYAMKIQITPALKFGTYVVTYTYAPSGKAPLNVVFTFKVQAPPVVKTILAGYLDGANNVSVTGVLNGTNYTPQVSLGEAFGYSAGFATANPIFSATATTGKIDYATAASHQFVMKVTSPAQSGYVMTNLVGSDVVALGVNPSNQGNVISLNAPITGASKVLNLQFITNYLLNGESDTYNYTLTFKNPLTVSVLPTANFTLIDNLNGSPSSQDLAANYVVSFLGTPIYSGGVLTTYGTSLVGGNIVGGTFNYSLTGVSTQYMSTSLAGSTMTWANAGSKLVIPQQTATANFTYGTTFATTAPATNAVIVNPGN